MDELTISPPIIVAADPDCWFYRSAADAVASGLGADVKVFDARGQRLEMAGADLHVSRTNPDCAQELAGLLRNWLGYMDAVRWSTADMTLPWLLKAAVEHLGYSA